ncbi:SGNH/GDSL hydrolase family protein [Pirellulaceae bacterium SH449]
MILKVLIFAFCHCFVADESVLALGDSYTIGEGVPEKGRWPVQLVQKLNEKGRKFTAPKIVAKTGWTTDELQAAIAETELAEQYDWVTLLIGVNNQYRGRDVEEYRRQFQALLQVAIKKAGDNPRRVVVLSIPDWGVTPFATKRGRDPKLIAEQIDQFNSINHDESKKGMVHYVDITPMTREAANQPEKFLVADELHPSTEMYEKWAKLAAEVILLEKEE